MSRHEKSKVGYYKTLLKCDLKQMYIAFIEKKFGEKKLERLLNEEKMQVDAYVDAIYRDILLDIENRVEGANNDYISLMED